ncbi:hypothetical protein LY76DRAFT_685938 [Colletotrichum caudatum]|nr:hypothetical protein LY76DRAFT_685938 [Colletotrichum caudatum]
MASTQLPVDSADRTVTISSADFKLLTDVYAHLAEYAATKDKSQVNEAVRIVDASNPAPWVPSVHLQDFMQKKPLTTEKAEKAVEEFSLSYPHMNPKGLEAYGLLPDFLATASMHISRHRDAFDLSWNVLRWFIPNLATHCKTILHTVRITMLIEEVNAATETAYEDAVAKVKAPGSASIYSSSSNNETANADLKATSGGKYDPNNHEVVEEPNVRKKTKKSKKLRNRATGDEESREPKRCKVNCQQSESTERSHPMQKLSADKIMQDELKEQRQQFMSKLDEQPPDTQPGLFRQAMLRLTQQSPITNLLEALQKTSSEENTD